MVKNSKPFRELVPGGALKTQVKSQTHAADMQKESKRVAAPGVPQPNATVGRLSAKFNARARDTGKER